jgi:putative secretion ATPase (PEP-CTERM system associated)
VYDTFYSLSGMPFQLTPDSRFFFGSTGHSRAIAHLTYGLAQGEGFIVITGEVGAGKTTLVEHLWAQLDRGTYTVARISTTQVSGDDLFRLAMAEFGVSDTDHADKSALLHRFERLLHDERAAGRRCLLVIDEVQSLSIPALEELRMLSNLTDGSQAALQTVLLGQPQFRPMLASPALDQLRQRVIASYHLGPLSEAETRAYIEHRLRTVGWTDRPSFEPAAFAAIHAHSGGIPRRINRLCSRVLLYGALEEALHITAAIVETTAAELHRDLEGGDGLASGLAAQHHAPPAYGAAAYGAPSATLAELIRRVDALEEQSTKRERVFQRLMDAFGAMGVR